MWQRFSRRSESSEPHVRLPSLGVQHREGTPQSIWVRRPAELNRRSPTGLGEREASLLKDTQRIPRALGPGAEAVI